MVADNKQRNTRLRLLIKRLNKERKRQAQKIDILCNDLITAQRQFIEKLNIIRFTANFYESILGSTALEDLLYTAVRMFKTESADVNVTFFLRHEDGPSTDFRIGASSGAASTDFELHVFESGRPILFEQSNSLDGTSDRLEDCFNPELMDNICKSNKVCTLDDMFAMGLQGNLTGLNKVSTVTIPLGLPGSSLGFMLIHRSSEYKLTAAEIDRIRAVTGGLSQAITSCQILSRTKSQEH